MFRDTNKTVLAIRLESVAVRSGYCNSIGVALRCVPPVIIIIIIISGGINLINK